MRLWVATVGLTLLSVGLLLLCFSGAEPWHPTDLHFAGQWIALATMVAGVVLLYVRHARARRRTGRAGDIP